MNGKTVAIIQARMSSTRLPGKVLKPLGNLPSIVFMVQRVRLAQTCDEVCVATSVDATDDALADALQQHDIPVFRGPLDDVLARYIQAADSLNADVVLRLTGDCPLIDPNILDRVVRMREKYDLDYASNVEPPTYPDGLNVETAKRAALDYAYQHARGKSDREHVTPVLRRNDRKELRIRNMSAMVDLSHLRWTVDHQADYEHVAAIVSHLGPNAVQSDMFDCLRAVEEAQLTDAGSLYRRNEAYRPD